MNHDDFFREMMKDRGFRLAYYWLAPKYFVISLWIKLQIWWNDIKAKG